MLKSDSLKEKLIIILSLILLCLAGGYGLAIYGGFVSLPYKIVDPADPRFDIERFRFEDYQSRERLTQVLEKVFLPEGMMEDVDRILVFAGGARKAGPFTVRDKMKERYQYPSDVEEYRYFKTTLRSYFTGALILLLPLFYSKTPMDRFSEVILIRRKERLLLRRWSPVL